MCNDLIINHIKRNKRKLDLHAVIRMYQEVAIPKHKDFNKLFSHLFDRKFIFKMILW
jgi:hypothetical protein